MKKSLESAVNKRAKYRAVQKSISLVLARITAQEGRLLFVTNQTLIKRLGISAEDENVSRKVYMALRRLEQKGLVTRNKFSSGWGVQLTPKGKKFAQHLDIGEKMKIAKPTKWDGKWRIVIFDIWERRRLVRDKLRRSLKAAGFYKVQDSVWAHPYDCEDLLVFLRADLRLGNGILYLIAEGIEGDGRMRSHFGLC